MRLDRVCFAVLAFVLLVLRGVSASAQESAPVPVISTERPTAGPSPDVLPAKSWQFESGGGLTARANAAGPPRKLGAHEPEQSLRGAIAGQ